MPFLISIFSLLTLAGLISWLTITQQEAFSWRAQALFYTLRTQEELEAKELYQAAREEYLKKTAESQEAREKKRKRRAKKQDPSKEEESSQGMKEQQNEERREARRRDKRTRSLHIASLFDAAVNESDAKYRATMFLLSRLSTVLFHHQPFYQQQGAGYFTELFTEVIQKIRKAGLENPKKRGESRAIELATYPINSQGGQYYFYKVMRGGGVDERQLNGAYASLLNYISLTKRTTLLSLYLASNELLLALFNDQKVVMDVMQARTMIHRQLMKDPSSKQQLTEQFKQKFTPLLPQEVPSELIDFEVSTTKPPDAPV